MIHLLFGANGRGKEYLIESYTSQDWGRDTASEFCY
jgi:hypothetical protein